MYIKQKTRPIAGAGVLSRGSTQFDPYHGSSLAADNGACRFPYLESSVPGQALRWFSLNFLEETSQPLGLSFCQFPSSYSFWSLLFDCPYYTFFLIFMQGERRKINIEENRMDARK